MISLSKSIEQQAMSQQFDFAIWPDNDCIAVPTAALNMGRPQVQKHRK